MMLIMRNLPRLVPLLCRTLSFSAPAQSCLGEVLSRLQIVWTELNWLHFSMGNKHAAELDVVLQERCPTSGTTSRTPNLIN